MGAGVLLGVLGLAAAHLHPAGDLSGSYHCALCQVQGLALDSPPQPPSVPASPGDLAVFLFQPGLFPRGDLLPAHPLARAPPLRS